jgi:hypothetical protein
MARPRIRPCSKSSTASLICSSVSPRHQLIKLQFAFAVPSDEQREVAIRSAVSAARAGKIPAADEQTGVQDRWEAGRRDADEQSVASSIKPRKSYFCCYS